MANGRSFGTELTGSIIFFDFCTTEAPVISDQFLNNRKLYLINE